MSQAGLGVMLQALSGGSKKSAKDYYGRKITRALFDESSLTLTFSDKVSIRLADEGQSCCESRYMTTDDDVKDLKGGILKSIKVVKVDENFDGEEEYHEAAFVKVQTDKDAVTIVTHVEHNGYYGGFALNIDEVDV